MLKTCDDYCCNYGCNQGRNCPAREQEEDDVWCKTWAWVSALLIALAATTTTAVVVFVLWRLVR